MARLQILELPEVFVGEASETPFVLVVDETVPQRVALGPDVPYRDYWQDIAQQIGARAVIVTPETVDIPANDTTAYLDASGQSWTRSDELRAQIQEEIAKAQAELTDVLNRQDAR
ncbi:MAG TPA: hypothetical protein VM093_02340 [Aeromicrobium sp.]|nr:hypothetical protein [Aeromicrobium sp.]